MTAGPTAVELHGRMKKPSGLSERAFAVLTILKHCLDKIAPQSHWPDRVRSLIADSPHVPIDRVPIDRMGFPDNWTDCPIWSNREGIGHGE
jgi:hypothetical protein